MKRIELPPEAPSGRHSSPKRSKVAGLFGNNTPQEVTPNPENKTYRASAIVEALTKPNQAELERVRELAKQFQEDDTALLTDEEDNVDKQKKPPSPSARRSVHAPSSRTPVDEETKTEEKESEAKTREHAGGLLKVPAIKPGRELEVRYVPKLIERAELRGAESEIVKERQLAKERDLEEKDQASQLASKPAYVTEGYKKRMLERKSAMERLEAQSK